LILITFFRQRIPNHHSPGDKRVLEGINTGGERNEGVGSRMMCTPAWMLQKINGYGARP